MVGFLERCVDIFAGEHGVELLEDDYDWPDDAFLECERLTKAYRFDFDKFVSLVQGEIRRRNDDERFECDLMEEIYRPAWI